MACFHGGHTSKSSSNGSSGSSHSSRDYSSSSSYTSPLSSYHHQRIMNLIMLKWIQIQDLRFSALCPYFTRPFYLFCYS